jgi:hypothetical protein
MVGAMPLRDYEDEVRHPEPIATGTNALPRRVSWRGILWQLAVVIVIAGGLMAWEIDKNCRETQDPNCMDIDAIDFLSRYGYE